MSHLYCEAQAGKNQLCFKCDLDYDLLYDGGIFRQGLRELVKVSEKC